MKAMHRYGARRRILIQVLIVVGLVCFGFCPGQPWINSLRAAMQTQSAVKQTFDRMPLCFVENQGQLDASVRFQARGPGREMFFTPTGVVFSMAGPDAPSIVRLTPIEMSDNVEVLGCDRQSTQVNIFRGGNPAQWRRHIPTFGSVLYQGVWPGVDLKFYGNHQHLEYDILVDAGADPSSIALRYDGLKEAALTESGDLCIGLKTGVTLIQKRPVAYQRIGNARIERRVVFKIIQAPSAELPDTPLIYGFDLAPYDRGQILVIDPVLVFSTFLGGSGADYGIEVAADSAGHTIVAGVTESTDFPTTLNAHESIYGGGQTDIFIAKVDKNGGRLIYATYLGGSEIELSGLLDGMSLYNFGLAVDKSGNVFVTSDTESADFPTTAGAYRRTLKGTSDAVVVKLKATGDELVYSTYLGGSGWEEAGGIAVDKSGNAYVHGGTRSNDFPTTAGAYRRSPIGDDDLFVTKLAPAGDRLVYSTYLGGSRWDESTAIAVDQSGNAVILGGGESSDYPTTAGAFDRSYNGPHYDVYWTKLNATGTKLLYSTFLGGSGREWAEGLALDSQANVYVSGETGSSNFPVSAGAFDTVYDAGSGKNGFVCKFAKDGSNFVRDYCTFLGNGENEIGTGVFSISIDGGYNAIVSGVTSSASFPTTVNAINRKRGGSMDGFVAKLSRHGDKLLYSSYLGGTGVEGLDAACGNAIDGYGRVHVTGLTNSVDFPIQKAFQPAHAGGGTDAFVAKISGLASLPTITITASDTTASESGSDPGKFTIRRTGGVRMGQSVTLSITGSATNGSDFKKIPLRLVIPPNCYTTTVAVTPVDETVVEGTETVRLTLVKSSSYAVGAQRSATVTIADNDK